jgi:hypothetical protein
VVRSHADGPLHQQPEVSYIVGWAGLGPPGFGSAQTAEPGLRLWPDHHVGLVDPSVDDPQIVEVGHRGREHREDPSCRTAGEPGEGQRLGAGPLDIDVVLGHASEHDDTGVAGSLQPFGLALQCEAPSWRQRPLPKQRPRCPFDDLHPMIQRHALGRYEIA